LIFVADRENGRVQCFNSINGTFQYQVADIAFGGRLFSVAYSKAFGGNLYAVNGPSPTQKEVLGFVIPLSTLRVSSVFKPSGGAFGNPHDIAVSKDGRDVYVVEISQPYKVWKFSRGQRSGKEDEAVVPSPPAGNLNSHSDTPQSIPSPSTAPLQETVNGKAEKDENFATSVIIMAFLTVPLLLLILFGAVMKVFTSGWCRRRNETKSFAEFFPPSAGFEKLKMEESESDDNSDTEVEEFAVSSYRKVPT